MQLPNAKLGGTGDPEYLAPGEDPGDLRDAGCGVVVIMTSKADVANWQGDPWLITNPAGTVGVKVVGTQQGQAGCLQVAARVLSRL